MLFRIFLILTFALATLTARTTRRGRPTQDAAATTQTTQKSTKTGRTSSKISSSSTTLSVPVGAYSTGWAGSVVSADGCNTVLALRCDGTSNDLCRSASDVTVTVTHSSNTYQLGYATSVSNGAVTRSESCVLNDSVSTASCDQRITTSVSGSSATTSSATTVISNFKYAPVAITADASKLKAASCTRSGNAAAATGMSDVYKVLVPLGAAAVAGAGALL